MKSLLVLFSYHHKNTEKIARVFAQVLDTPIKSPLQITPEELQEYDLIGFGSGIYHDRHHESLLDLADRLPPVENKNAFIFSTCGAPAIIMRDPYSKEYKEYVEKNNLPLKEKLRSRGYVIVGEFTCPGLNTNKFLKYFGGLNKGRPNAEDLKNAAEFAQNLKNNPTI